MSRDPNVIPIGRGRLRELPIDRDLVAMGMEDHSGFTEYWLDTRTGQVQVISEALAFLDPFDEEAAERIRSEAGDELLAVLRGIHGDGGGYEAVPRIESEEMYGLMSRFASGIEEAELARPLEVALRGRGAFGRFKAVLAEHPDERERWFRVRDAFIADRQLEWLSELGIVPAE